MIQSDLLFLCHKCKENQKCKQDILNDGLYLHEKTGKYLCHSEVIMRCGKCGQSNFEANSYLRKEVSAETEKRRKWWYAKQFVEEAKKDLEAFEAMNDMAGIQKARASVAKYTKKMSECEDEVYAQHQHQR